MLASADGSHVNRRRYAALALVLIVAALALALPSLHSRSSRAATGVTRSESPSAGATAYEYMAELSDEIGPRVAGTPSEARAAARITDWFADLGYEPTLQPFALENGGSSRSSANVIGVKPGTSARQIVIGAHYDSVAKGRGAFDNASGVALLLELAGVLRTTQTPYSLVFVAFGAEEIGFRGSKAYLASLTATQKAAIVLMVDLDSVAAGDQMYAYSGATEAWPQLTLRSMARQKGITILTSPGLNKDYPYGSTGDWSDHVVFAKQGIPYLYVEATNWLLGDKDGDVNSVKAGKIWHTGKDTISYIEQRFPGRMEAQLDGESAALAAFLTTYSR
jgi:alkaline phosphatase isozyme conversion protein